MPADHATARHAAARCSIIAGPRHGRCKPPRNVSRIDRQLGPFQQLQLEHVALAFFIWRMLTGQSNTQAVELVVHWDKGRTELEDATLARKDREQLRPHLGAT
jgi:hypothetical protein